MKRLKDYYVTIILIAAVIIINIAAFGLYIVNVNRDIEKQTKDHLAEIMEDASTCVELKMEETIHELEMAAFYISMTEDYKEGDVLDKAARMSKKAGFASFDIADENGVGLEINGGKDYSGTKMFRKVMAGEVYIIDTSNEEGSITGIDFAVPIVTEDHVVKGAFVTKCSLDEFYKLMDLDSVSNKGKAFIIKTNGTVLSRTAKSSIQNVSDILNDDSHVKTLKNYMKSTKSGVIGFENGKKSKRYICYSNTNFNSWKIIMVVSSGSVEANISDVTDNFVFLGVIIGIMLVVLIVYFIYTLIAVQSKNAINLRRYYMVARYTEDIIFDYSCVKDTIYCNENWKKIFGYEPPRENFSETIKNIIPKSDYKIYEEHIDELKKSDELVQFKCHIFNNSKREIECICKVFGVKDNQNKLVKIVGVIEKCV